MILLNKKIKIDKNLWEVFPKDRPENINLSWDFDNKIIYGPAISRRFGLSLGINLYPVSKICNFNCNYCLAGEKNKRRKLMSKNEIINILEDDLNKIIIKNKLLNIIDSIGFCGNGEPTLHPDFFEISQFIIDYKEHLFNKFGKKIYIGTFSNVSFNKKIIPQLSKMDILIFKLDAVSEQTFLKINRTKIRFSKIIDSLLNFPSPYIISTALILSKKANNLKEIKSSFHKLLNKLKNPLCFQLYNINPPTPDSTIKHLYKETIISIGKHISKKINIPVELLMDNKYVV